VPRTDSDRLRIGDAERDAVAKALHDHFAAGRLTREELDQRLDATLAAKTRGDLAAVVHDLPEPTGLPRPSVPAFAPMPGWAPGFAPHPAFAHRHHPAFAHHHTLVHGHRRRHVVFPVLLAVFTVTTFTLGAGAGLLAVLHLGLLVWTMRAVALTPARRRARRADEPS